MLPSWQFLLDRGVNFRTKRMLLALGFPAVYQLAEVGLTGLAKDPEIFREAQQRRLVLISKDTDFILATRCQRSNQSHIIVLAKGGARPCRSKDERRCVGRATSVARRVSPLWQLPPQTTFVLFFEPDPLSFLFHYLAITFGGSRQIFRNDAI